MNHNNNPYQPASPSSTLMPPRRSTRASSAAPKHEPRSARPSPPPRIAEGDSDAPSDDSEASEVYAPVKKPAARRPSAKPKAPVPTTTRRTTRGTTAALTPEPEDDAPPVRVANKKPAKGRKKVVQSEPDSEDDEDVQESVKLANSKSASRRMTSEAPAAALPEHSEGDDDDVLAAATPLAARPPPSKVQKPAQPVEEDSEEDNLLEETIAPQTPRSRKTSSNSGKDSVESSPDIPDHVLPPKTPGRSAPALAIPATPTPAPPPAGPKPRLTIHKLVLNNFKSYGGRQEIGPFHKSFSAIVGPNGSGKSNTIDALLFVFGFRASKMRQGKLSELIHNSASLPNVQECSVEIWFREIIDLPGVDNFALVPNSEILVKRTAFKDNTSKYTINNTRSSRDEVVKLLKGKGIDLDHNRFLILQGEVESIALMKPKAQTEHEDGLLEYLEDIIGTTQYKERIESASKEVEELNDQRGERMNRLRVVEREKASLENKKREAESFLRYTNELTRKRSLLWQTYMFELSSGIDLAAQEIESLNAELAAKQEANADLLAHVDSLQKHYDEKLSTYQQVKQVTDALQKNAKQHEKEELSLQEKRKHLVSKQKKLKKSIAEDSHVRSEALASIEGFESQLESSKSKITELERKLEVEEAELEEVRDSLKDKTDEFTTKIEIKQRELEPWTAKISEKQSAIDVAQSERDLLAQKATSAQSAFSDAEAGIIAARNYDKEKREEYSALKKEVAKAQKELAAAEQKLQSIAAQADEARSRATASRQKSDEAKSSLAADKSENAVLSSLNKLKAQGRIKGFHGRLGDLGVIDDKYDVAVTTACPALNNLVVDTVEQGQACIEHLRKGNIGRASIIVLEKLPARDLGPIQTPEGVPRLFDLIKPKESRFAPAFFKGVSNTLVAEDMKQAQRIAYSGKQRYRVVTLAGQMIEASGAMSGGGNRVARGGMSSKLKSDKVAPAVVARYEQECAAAEEELASIQADKRSVEQVVTQLRKRVPDTEMQLEKVELDVQTGAKRIAEAERRLAEIESQSKPDEGDEKRIRALDAEIASLTKDVNKLREKSSLISDQIKDLQNRILEVGGVRLRAIQSKFTTTKGLLDLANDSVTKAEVGQAKASHDAEKMQKSIKSNTIKLDEVEIELADFDADLAVCTKQLEEIRDSLQKAQDETSEFQEDLAEAKAELDEASTEINSFRKFEMTKKQKIEDLVRDQKDNQAKYKHWAKRHEELELAYVDEDEDVDEEGGDVEQAAEKAGPVQEETSDGEGQDVKPEVHEKTKEARNGSTELVEFSAKELEAVNKEFLKAEIASLEEEIAQAKPNLNVLHEYRRREAEFLERAKDLETVTNRRDDAKKMYDDLRKVRLDEFMAGFSAISAKLKEMYQMITMGGNAEIELVDTMDPFSEGVVLSIMPPKKSWRPIANLSGGEKTLASLALVFALHVFKPTPLYFMDEIDAALDFKNVSIVANYIQSKTQAAQFIVISLRNDMFELAHRLVGIYKTNNCTKSIAIDNKDLRTQAVSRKPPPTPGNGLKTGQIGGQTPATKRSTFPSTPAAPSTPTPMRTVLPPV